MPVRKENQVEDEDEQYIVHDAPVSLNNNPIKGSEVEVKQSTDESKTVLSDDDKTFDEELYQLQLQDDLAKAYSDAQRQAFEENKKRLNGLSIED